MQHNGGWPPRDASNRAERSQDAGRRAETTSRYAHIAANPLKTAADAIASKLVASMGEPVGEGRQ